MEVRVACEQRPYHFGWTFQQTLQGRNADARARSASSEVGARMRRQIQELQHPSIVIGGISHEVIEERDEASFTADDVKEAPYVLAEPTDFFIVEEPRIEAAIWNAKAKPAFGDEFPRALKVDDAFIAIANLSQMKRRQHLQRITNGYHEFALGPHCCSRRKSLRRVQVGNRSIEHHCALWNIRKEMVDIFFLDAAQDDVRRNAGKLAAREEVRFLDVRQADVGMIAQVSR